MSVVLRCPPAPPWVNRDLPRAPLRLTRGGHSAPRVGHLLLTTGTGYPPGGKPPKKFGRRGKLDTHAVA
jgi:hypothetical protein